MIDNVVIVSSGTVKGTQPCMHAYPFSPKFPSPPGCHITLSRVPYAIQSSLLVIHFKYSSAYMTFPMSLTVPSPDNHKFIF